MLDFLGGLVGAGLNYYGAREANRANKHMAREQMEFQRGSNREAMDFSRESAREQMAFQERMSNTAYQRSMEDMKKAGLNPILAFSQGGASTPSGSSASGQASSGSQAHMRNKYAGSVSSAMAIKRASAEIKNLNEQNKQIQSQTLLNKALTEQSSAQSVKTTVDTFTGKALGGLLPSLLQRIFGKK